MIEVGRLGIKLLGRDAGKIGVVVKKLDENYVILDGNVRRRKVNIKHFEPINKKVSIKENASTEEVLKTLSSAGITITKNLKKESKESAKEKKESKTSKSKSKKE